MDRLAELAEYDRSIAGLIDDDFLAAGFTPDEIASYRGTFTPPSLTPQDISQAEQTYGTLQAPDYTMRETSTQRVQDALINQLGLDPYLAGRYARDIMGDTSPTSQNILDGLGLADLTPLGAVSLMVLAWQISRLWVQFKVRQQETRLLAVQAITSSSTIS